MINYMKLDLIIILKTRTNFKKKNPLKFNSLKFNSSSVNDKCTLN